MAQVVFIAQVDDQGRVLLPLGERNYWGLVKGTWVEGGVNLIPPPPGESENVLEDAYDLFNQVGTHLHEGGLTAARTYANQGFDVIERHRESFDKVWRHFNSEDITLRDVFALFGAIADGVGERMKAKKIEKVREKAEKAKDEFDVAIDYAKRQAELLTAMEADHDGRELHGYCTTCDKWFPLNTAARKLLYGEVRYQCDECDGYHLVTLDTWDWRKPVILGAD